MNFQNYSKIITDLKHLLVKRVEDSKKNKNILVAN